MGAEPPDMTDCVPSQSQSHVGTGGRGEEKADLSGREETFFLGSAEM